MMTKRERRCFKRLVDGKSLPDFACLCGMADKGWVSISGGSDDMEIKPTEAGDAVYRGSTAA